jgi:hypothetical protein
MGSRCQPRQRRRDLDFMDIARAQGGSVELVAGGCALGFMTHLVTKERYEARARKRSNRASSRF